MKVIGIDVDGTLSKYSSWKGIDFIDDPLPNAKTFIQELKNDGWTICLWSTRADIYLRKWAATHGIIADYFNESPYVTDSNKQSFDLYVGDEALRFDGDFTTALYKIKELQCNRHWGVDSFDRDVVTGDRNPEIYYRGTGQLFLDVFDGLTDKLWEKHNIKENAFLTICSHAKPYSKSWIHCEIKRALHNFNKLTNTDYIHISSAGIIPANACHEASIINRYDWNGSEITNDIVKLMLRNRITDRLRVWFEMIGKNYNKRYVYLRPSGNTIRAIQEANIPIEIIPVTEFSSPEWADFPDVDDCLADPRNLINLENI